MRNDKTLADLSQLLLLYLCSRALQSGHLIGRALPATCTHTPPGKVRHTYTVHD